jgi:uncharacterized membrane protein
MWDHSARWGVWMIFLVTIVFVAAIVAALVFVVRAMTMGGQTPSSTPEGSSPKDILKRRYAGGKIDREEFHRRLRDLES